VRKLSSRSVDRCGQRDGAELARAGELLLHYGTEEQKQHYLPRSPRARRSPASR
jgi:hypothetical protein